MASIRKLPSAKYQVQIRLKNLSPVVKSFTTKKNAQAFIRTVEGDTELLRKLGSQAPISISFKQLTDMYMQQYTGKDASIIGRANYWSDLFGKKDVTEIDEFMVDDVLVSLSNRITGSSVNRYKSTLSSIFIYFIQHPKYKRIGFTNPVRKESVTKFSENPAKERLLSADEQKKLLSACKQALWDRLYLLVLMALTTGARRGELLSLRFLALTGGGVAFILLRIDAPIVNLNFTFLIVERV
jgi:integrase